MWWSILLEMLLTELFEIVQYRMKTELRMFWRDNLLWSFVVMMDKVSHRQYLEHDRSIYCVIWIIVRQHYLQVRLEGLDSVKRHRNDPESLPLSFMKKLFYKLILNWHSVKCGIEDTFSAAKYCKSMACIFLSVTLK